MGKKGMTSRERVLAVLNRKEPDRVPFCDWVEPGLKRKVEKYWGEEELDYAEVAIQLGMDMITMDAYYAPFFCKRYIQNGLQVGLGEGYIKTENDLYKMEFPDPYNESYYDTAKQWLDKYGDTDFAIGVGLRTAWMNTIYSMGFMDFAVALKTNIPLVTEVMKRFTEWNCVVVEKLHALGRFDFFYPNDDLGYKSGPFVSPQDFREIMIPPYKPLADTFKRLDIKWVLHSDGAMSSLIPDLLPLGMSALNPLQPDCCNIKEVKEKYGDKVAVWGNIDLNYTLTRGIPAEVDAEVKQRIKECAIGGGYICSSANSLTDYCKVENVLAMRDAIMKYGNYSKQ